MAQIDLEAISPLTTREQLLWKRAISEAKELQRELLVKRGGKLFPNAGDAVNQSRDQRSQDLTGSTDE